MDGISVILTYYNGSKYIAEQINSLLMQSVQFDELLIFDDCSNADEYRYLEDFVKELNDSRIKLSKNQRNLGYAANFIFGVKQAKYDTIFLCDQDDVWQNDKLELMSRILKEEKIDLLCSDIEPFYSSATAPKWDSDNLKTMKNDKSIEFIDADINNIHLKRSGSAMCFRKAFFDNIKNYWKDNWGHDDFLWKFGVFGGRCAIYHNALTCRRLHDTNTSEIKVRTLKWRIEELEGQNEDLLALISGLKSNGIQARFDVIEQIIRANNKRLLFLKGKNIFRWIGLFFKYRYAYPRIKGLYLDLYLFIFKTYKCK